MVYLLPRAIDETVFIATKQASFIQTVYNVNNNVIIQEGSQRCE